MSKTSHNVPQIEVFYDGECPICAWEVDLYGRMDKSAKIEWTAIEGLSDAALPSGKTRDELLGKFHVREAGAAQWHIGVDAFARIWRALPGLRHVAFLFSVPGIRQLTKGGYVMFLRWQSWHRKRRV